MVYYTGASACAQNTARRLQKGRQSMRIEQIFFPALITNIKKLAICLKYTNDKLETEKNEKNIYPLAAQANARRMFCVYLVVPSVGRKIKSLN